MPDYSRFDHIIDSSDEEEAAAPALPPRPPPNVLEDLEDYFRRLDERSADAAMAASANDDGDAGVPHLSDEDLAELDTAAYVAGDGLPDCSICLAEFEAGENLVRLPCAARHAFHPACAASWLSRSVQCPMCRVDVRSIVRALRAPAPPSPRQLGRTRDGGVILRYEPTPPPDMPRPDYIPADQRRQAGYVEIEYPEHGVARVWRMPR